MPLVIFIALTISYYFYIYNEIHFFSRKKMEKKIIFKNNSLAIKK
jgi:hypothetical protein